MQFCSHCGGSLTFKQPDDDDRERHYCPQCDTFHYQNQSVLVATFLYCGNKLFWAKRGTPPFQSKWAFPAGFLEQNETLQQAAARELKEETCIDIDPKTLIPMSLGSVLSINQLYIVFRRACEEELCAQITPETEEWGWFSEDEAPWDEMAYPQTEPQVRQVYQWVQAEQFGIRVGEVNNEGGDYTTFAMQD